MLLALWIQGLLTRPPDVLIFIPSCTPFCIVQCLSHCLQDFVFCKEVRLGSYAPSASSLPPAAIVAAKAMASDPRAEPRYRERVPYVVRPLPSMLHEHDVALCAI
jgi:hypothetical protein